VLLPAQHDERVDVLTRSRRWAGRSRSRADQRRRGGRRAATHEPGRDLRAHDYAVDAAIERMAI
jgi:hypothetical protein